MYNDFAYIYDRLMGDVDYTKWADYTEKIFRENGIASGLVLDLGCGTGSFCIEMAKRHYEMIGVDGSAEMLSCAKSKSLQEGVDVLYLNQDMAGFELYGTVRATVCYMDSINYITNKNKVKKALKLVKNYMDPGGIFIFDINSKYKLENMLGNNVFYEVGDDITYIWQNTYDSKRRICEFDLTFFIKDGEVYERHDEIHSEKAYEVDEIVEMVEQAGMKVLNIFDDLSFNSIRPESERIFFVCKKE